MTDQRNKNVYSLSRTEKAQLLLKELPGIEKLKNGKELCAELRGIVKDTSIAKKELRLEVREIGVQELFSRIASLQSAKIESRKNSSSKKLNGTLRLNRNDLLSSIKEKPLFEHPAILVSKFEGLENFEKEKAFKSLPGKTARHVSFLLASK